MKTNSISISYVQTQKILFFECLSTCYFQLFYVDSDNITSKMNQISQTCSLCNKPNDQMLMLSCVHDPCINCAASAYAEQVYIKGQSKDVYLCQICGEETLLDTSTIAQLNALANAVIKLPTKNPVNKASTTAQPIKKKQTQQPVYNVVNNGGPNVSAKKIIYYCKQHSQQQISYYCFTCCANICPECAIHGSHKAHEVKLIKKAISQVKGQYMELVGKVNDSQTIMNRLKQGFLRLIKQTNDRNVRQKNTITRQFDIIRAQLAAKQKELLKDLQDINKQNMTALTTFLQTINTNTEDATKLKRSIQAITKKDQVLILQDYRKINEIQQSLLKLNKTTQSINGQSYHLNIQFLQQQCKQILDNIGVTKLNQKKQQIGSSKFGGASNSKTIAS